MTTRKKSASATSDFLLKLHNNNINAAVDLLLEKKVENNGRLPHGAMNQILSDLKTSGVVTDRDHLNYLVSKRGKKGSQGPPLQIIVDSGTALTDGSTITGHTGIVNGNANFCETDSNISESVVDSLKRGRPSGTTAADQRERQKLKTECVNCITTTFAKEVEKCKRLNRNAPSKFLKHLILQKWEEYDLDPNHVVSCNTIRSRLQRGNLLSERIGSRPLLPVEVEKVVVDIVVMMAKIRHPLSVCEIVELANSVIEKTEYQETISKWKSSHFPHLPLQSSKLGYGWWRGFSNRHNDVLVVKRGERFASDRAEWSKEIYIRQMYDVIYDNLVNAGIAVKLPESVFMNASGNIVDNPDGVLNSEIVNIFEDKPLGLPCDTKIIHPEYLLFFDETGCNTNQKKDGHYGGEKLVCARGMTPKQICSSRDKHFTVLGLTAATGEPVLCVVIFASEKKGGVVANWSEGIDLMVDPVLDEKGEVLVSDINFGQGKYFPSGPTCCFRGKHIPYLPLSSPSGGITGELLVEILKWLDTNDVFERVPGGPAPFLLLDGHESRLSAVFIDYITDPNHIWHVNLGIPHATSYWQVGDSPEQNGHFKQLLSKAKKELVTFKIRHNMPVQINSEDIIPLINKAWGPSFANKVTNQKAIAARGWFPLNRNLLLHKEIKETCEGDGTTTNENSENETDLPFTLNSDTGTSGVCFQKMMQHCLRHGGIARNSENLRNGESIQDTFQKAKRISSTVMIRRRIHEVNHPDVVNMIKSNRDRMIETEKNTLRKRRKEILNRIKVITKLRLTKPSMNDWNMKDCRDYLQYKKRNGDPKMPGTLILLKNQCVVIDGRSSPDCSVHESDDEDDNLQHEAEDLLNFAANCSGSVENEDQENRNKFAEI
jgi:hypothetical protein